uniref:E3 ubiquitin-protein ligase listerin n=1 Tax=Sinocyclocheilus grahami TaxID=75366 RepID=A0A672SBT7_SINGR
MGGKNKQRTKGNVRPSSSGRAADLLARESGVVPGFVGFGVSTSSDPGYVPAVQGAEEIDNQVDADFRMVLRKLSKRDAVTKLKAVQEFGAMCQERQPDVVKGVLPYWPRIYCRISMDHDRRVREATQQAFEQLVLKVKRNLAPYLKSIMGHWLISQCDTYSPAASAASAAFQAAFPLNKQPEAISFCKDEVLNVLQDNLLKETADTLSDPHSVPEEEREAKFIRLLTSSLLALKRLLSILPEQDRELLKERLTQLITQGKFWKYSKHKTPQVRAFFELIATMCAHTPQLIQAEAARACSAVLLSIDDTDPVVLPPLWEAVLHILSCNCWTHVSARKGVMPKLWVLLKEGGRGLATSLHPNMLPFISKLPAEVTQPNLEFSRTFLTSVIQGLSSDRAKSSPSESAAIIFATMECLRFIILQNVGDEQEQRNIQNMLISEQLLPLIDRALGNPSLQTGPLFPQVSDMLLSWEKRAVGKEAPTFQRLLSDFWEGLGRLCTTYVDREEAERTALEGIALLVQIMHNPNSASKQTKKKKTVKICFTDREERGQGDEPPMESPALEEQHCPLRNGHLLDLVCQLAELNMLYVSKRESERHLRFLSQLLRVFPSPQVFQVLLRPEEMKPEMGPELRPLAENAAVHFLLQRVTIWLKQDDRKDTDFLVDMVFSSLQCCCSSDDKTLILNHISVRDPHDPVRLEVFIGWLRGPVLGERLVGLAGELCVMGLRGSPSSSSHHAHGWPLISLALSQQHNNDPLIGKAYVEQIIDKLHATLSEAKGMSDAGNMEPLVTFISDVAATFFSSIKGCLLLASAEELLMTVFQLCAQDQTITHLSDALLMNLQHAYTAGIQSLITNLGAGVTKGTLLHNIALWVKSQLLTTPLTVKSLQLLVQAVESLSQTIASAQKTSCLLSQFIFCLNPTEEEWSRIRRALLPQWVRHPLLCGRLRVTGEYPCMDVWKFRATNRLPAHLCVSALLGRIIFTATSPDDQQVEADFSEIPDLKHIDPFILFNHRSQEEGSLWSLALAKYMQNSKMEPSHIKALYGNTARENSSMFWNPWVQLFVCANCDLIVRLSEFFMSPPAGVEEQLPPELNSEWKEFFLEGIHNLLLPLLIKIPGHKHKDKMPTALNVAYVVGEALTYIPVELLTQNKLPPRFVADQRSSLPEPLQTLLNTLSPLLLFKARPLQLAVYHILHKYRLYGEEPCLSPPAALMSILSATEELLDSILGGVQVGEFAVVQPLSMEHCCILGYLLAWKLLFTFFKASSSHLRAQYSLHLKKTRSLHKLLLHLFRLMPEIPSVPGQPAEPSSKEPKTFFTESLVLIVSLQFEVPHLACSVYYGALKDLPAMVRLWWNSQEKRVFSTVDKFTSKYVSGVLSVQEIASVQSSTQTFENMTVKARSATREVIATYSVDDIFIELVIQLPQNYPLGSILVESGRRVGVAVQQWRNWMLQLNTYLTHQNGSILEGLSLWKNNVDKRFEGVEDCMICFSVIHGSNYSLPKKACRTCKKKFHSACLYKWFTSSNKSTCPLCRETFF